MTASSAWRPSLGAWCDGSGVHFRVWAPQHQKVELVLEDPGGPAQPPLLERDGEGYWGAFVPDLRTGARYWYRLDGEGPFPDPVSRFQPDGVHGPSQVVDATSFPWSTDPWSGVGLEGLVIYELHVGTFSPEGSFDGASRRLDHLVDLGVTAVELMPLGDFPGQRGWGYDGVDVFAPARCYGTPDELRRLVDTAHAKGLGVLLDVVYNHLGPDGAYLGRFSPLYFSDRHATPWGAAVNLDGPGSEHVRAFLLENALHWLNEYRLDGLRLDATHAIHDDSPRHFLAELQARARGSVGDRRIVVIAEDSRNLAHLVRPETRQGFGLDAVWADDLHHQVRRHLAGDEDGYYRDFTGSMRDLARTVRDGWFYQGQRSCHSRALRGTDPTGEPLRRFVVCLQNHDQIGNRATGERLHHQVSPEAWRAASALLLLAPETPLLFMGQEWAATTPFLYFTDHGEELGRLVTEGRRKEFEGFAAFASPESCERIPDPQSESTFRLSRLIWSEREASPHREAEQLCRALLALRKEECLSLTARDAFFAQVVDDGSIAFGFGERPGASRNLLAIIRLSGSGPTLVPSALLLRAGAWTDLLSTEDRRFASDPLPIRWQLDADGLVAHFHRPGALLLGQGGDASAQRWCRSS